MEYKCGCKFVAKSAFGLMAHKRKSKNPECNPPKKQEDIIEPPEIIAEPSNDVTINLQNTITINGHRYGGTVTVDPSLAQDLRYRDSVINQRLIKETTTIDRIDRNLGNIR